MPMDVESLDWAKMEDLVPAVVQNVDNGRILMLGYMNKEALRTTLDSRMVVFWSRSRNELWQKGETSGNALDLVEIKTDCDRDALLVLARPRGPVCHKGPLSCFLDDNEFVGLEFLDHLERLVQERRTERPDGSYVTGLFEKGLDAISQKVGEEAVELVISAHQEKARTVEETADLLFHTLLFLSQRGLKIGDVLMELGRRHKSDREATLLNRDC